MAKLVTIFGGSGFVGRHVVRLMAKRGWRVRVAVRRPDEALFTRTYGAVGQVVPVLCNIRDEMSVRAAMSDADAVVNCVNIERPEGKSNFTNVFEQGAEHIARLSAEMGVARIVHLSGIGVDPKSASRYIASKARGEAAVLKPPPRCRHPATLGHLRSRRSFLQPLCQPCAAGPDHADHRRTDQAAARLCRGRGTGRRDGRDRRSRNRHLRVGRT